MEKLEKLNKLILKKKGKDHFGDHCNLFAWQKVLYFEYSWSYIFEQKTKLTKFQKKKIGQWGHFMPILVHFIAISGQQELSLKIDLSLFSMYGAEKCGDKISEKTIESILLGYTRIQIVYNKALNSGLSSTNLRILQPRL